MSKERKPTTMTEEQARWKLIKELGELDLSAGVIERIDRAGVIKHIEHIDLASDPLKHSRTTRLGVSTDGIEMTVYGSLADPKDVDVDVDGYMLVSVPEEGGGSEELPPDGWSWSLW